MAGKKNGGGNNLATIVIGVIAVCIAGSILVGSTEGRNALESFGMRGASVSQLKPGADSQKKNDLKVRIPKPGADSQRKNDLGITIPKPGEDSQGKNNLGLTLPAPSASPSASATSPAPSTDATPNRWPAAANATITPEQALTELDKITTGTPHLAGYAGNRELLFGKWQNSSQLCGSGTTRDLIMKRDMTDVAMTKACKVQTGVLQDPYTGKTIRFDRSKSSLTVQIDHVVAVQDAWASGLWGASAQERLTYANDPDVLLAVDGPANEQKGSGVASLISSKSRQAATRAQWGGEVWMPSNKAYRCDYMVKRVEIKTKYGLSMTQAEKTETKKVLEACPME